MKTLILTLLLICSTVLGAGTTLPVMPGELEPIHFFKIADGAMSIGVATRGYTNEQSFRVDVAKGEREKTYTLRVVRISPTSATGASKELKSLIQRLVFQKVGTTSTVWPRGIVSWAEVEAEGID